MISTMCPRTRFTLPPLDLGEETFGQRLARIRKERGFTQTELADRVGIIQVLISDYERDRIRMHAEMIVRFAKILGICSDELLGLKQGKNGSSTPKVSRRVLRRVEQIDKLAANDQRALLRTIDAFLQGVHAQRA